MHILVVGSGLLGTSSAWFLCQQGADVTVVDRADQAGMETSFANAGMLTPSMADPWNSPGIFWQLLRWLGREESPMLLRPTAIPSLISWGWRFLGNSRRSCYEPNLLANLRLASYSLSVLRGLRAGIELPYDQSTTGTMRIARDREALREAEQLATLLSARGIAHRVLDRDGVVATEPALSPIAEKISCGIHYPDDESGDAHLFCRALSEQAKRAGVEFRFGTSVTGFRREGRRVIAAQVGGEELEADAFVLAAGSFSPRLARPLGIRLPIKPVKGYSITVPRGDWSGAPRIPVADDELHAAVVPIGDRIRVAGTAEFAGLDVTIGERRIANLERLLHRIYPSFADRSSEVERKPWCGLRPMSADGVPIVGSTSHSNFYLNTGHGHLGWTMAAGSAKALADQIIGEQPEIDMADYNIARF
ncbi:MAG: D-amino acid dehydrogenase [Gammaproteobacteria bacterium]